MRSHINKSNNFTLSTFNHPSLNRLIRITTLFFLDLDNNYEESIFRSALSDKQLAAHSTCSQFVMKNDLLVHAIYGVVLLCKRYERRCRQCSELCCWLLFFSKAHIFLMYTANCCYGIIKRRFINVRSTITRVMSVCLDSHVQFF